MDPLSHAALGRTLIALAPPARISRAAIVTATLGALSPDVDAVFMPFGWDRYLRVHEVGTHTIGGVIVCGLMTAVAVRAFARHAAFLPLVFAGCMGAASHVALDLLSSARLRVFWPLADRQVSIPLVAMADPWLAAILLAGALALWFGHGDRRWAAASVALVAAFLTVKAVLGLRAYEAYRTATEAETVSNTIVEARWGSMAQWHVYDRTANQVRIWRVSAGSPAARMTLAWSVGAETPGIAGSRALPAVRNFLRAHALPFPVSVQRSGNVEWILWSDIRYCWNASGVGAPRVEPVITVNGSSLACALWFGGEFDARGTALRQIVKVGEFMQTRPADR